MLALLIDTIIKKKLPSTNKLDDNPLIPRALLSVINMGVFVEGLGLAMISMVANLGGRFEFLARTESDYRII